MSYIRPYLLMSSIRKFRFSTWLVRKYSEISCPKVTDSPDDMYFHKLISDVKQKCVSASQISYHLSEIAKQISIKNFQVINTEEETMVKQICISLDKYASQDLASPLHLFRAHRALKIIGISSESHEMQSLVQHLLWNVKKMNMSLLLSSAKFYFSLDNISSSEDVLVKEITNNIQKRWVEVTALREVKLIYAYQKQFSKTFLGKFEERVLELIEHFSVGDLIDLLVLMSKLSLRPLPVIRSINYHLVKHKEQYSIEDCSQIIFLMCSLSTPDISLLNRLSSDIISNIQRIQSEKLVINILNGIGQLRWRSTDILDCLTEWVLHNKACLELRLACLNTLAHVNYSSPFLMDIIQSIPESEVNRLKEDEKVCTVWGFCVFNLQTDALLDGVLKDSVYSSLKSRSNKIKLQNIASFSLSLGKHTPQELVRNLNDVVMDRPQSAVKFSQAVIKTIENILPAPKFLESGKTFPINVLVDAIFYFDKQNNPLSINQASRAHTKVCVYILHLRDMCLSSDHMTGISALNISVLRNLGYTTLLIPWNEFPMQDKTLGRVKYIQNLLNQIKS